MPRERTILRQIASINLYEQFTVRGCKQHVVILQFIRARLQTAHGCHYVVFLQVPIEDVPAGADSNVPIGSHWYRMFIIFPVSTSSFLNQLLEIFADPLDGSPSLLLPLLDCRNQIINFLQAICHGLAILHSFGTSSTSPMPSVFDPPRSKFQPSVLDSCSPLLGMLLSSR